ncbi:MAG: metallophosphoesterase [Evtepia gabavorous]
MFFLPLLLLSLLLWVLWGNRTLLIHEIPLSLPGLPPAFDGMRIAQVSDLHNASFGKENRRLLQALSQAKPHLIVLTGDLVDSRRTNLPRALAFAARAAELAPTYFVPGNHEARLPQYPALKSGLKDAGVVVLRPPSPCAGTGKPSPCWGWPTPASTRSGGFPVPRRSWSLPSCGAFCQRPPPTPSSCPTGRN